MIMNPREQSYIENWEQKHGKGKWTFLILSHIVWGGLLVLAYASLRLAMNGLLSIHNLGLAYREYGLWKWWLVLSVALFLVEFILWQLAYRKYLSFKKKQSASA